MKPLICLFISFMLLNACRQPAIVNPKDYAASLTAASSGNKALGKSTAEIAFWKMKLEQDTGSFVYMQKLAYEYIHRFQLDAVVENLAMADSLLLRVAAKLNSSDPAVFYTLGQNAITRHRFRDALSYEEKAMKTGGREAITNFLLFDVYMELGRYSDAQLMLNSLQDKQSFDYLIRAAKWQDHLGNLDAAIQLMEQAWDLVKKVHKKSIQCWTLSNLGDMYGHAGRVKDAYDAYLDVLQLDQDYLYALKGIAWIAYARDGNTAEAKKIINALQQRRPAPDYKLELAEIAEYEGNEKEKTRLLQEFYQEVNQPRFGAMYNKYLAMLEGEEFNNAAAAVAIAEQEVKNRPSAETWDLLAWTYYLAGRHPEALAIVEKEIEGKSFEPDAAWHSGYIYAANNKPQEARRKFNEALESAFELGPVTVKRIRGEISQ